MRTLELATRIDAPRERVFDLARHVDVHRDTMPGDEDVVGGVTTGLLEHEDEVTFRARYFGVTWTLTARVAAFDRPRRFRDVQLDGPFLSLTHEHRFQRLPEGTRMLDHVTFEAPLGPLGRLAEPLIEWRLGRALRARNRALARLAEGDGWRAYLDSV